MANQVSARLKGDDYQHLYSWYLALDLLRPGSQVAMVRIEDEKAWSADDVTIQHTPESGLPDQFYQIKNHVDHRKSYSTALFTDHKPNEKSLLQKLFKTWQELKAQARGRPIELHFISNWAWDTSDKMASCISGDDNSLTDLFYNATPRSDVGKLRQQWIDHLGLQPASVPEFFEFSGTLRIWTGYACWDVMKRMVKERMSYLRLKFDETALLVAVGIVREWIKSGVQVLTTDMLEEIFVTHDLYIPPDEEPSVHVYLTTIKDQHFDISPDFWVDWRSYFEGNPNKKGHSLADPDDWNRTLLPQLETLEAQVNSGTSCRLIRARGLARLSAWLAFGFTFSEVNRYTIEVDQQGEHWRTDATPSPDFSVASTVGSDGEILDGEGSTVAVGISVSGQIDEDVRRHLAERDQKVASLLLIRPNRELGRECLRGAGDAVALASESKRLIRDFVARWGAKRLLLYYYGPLGGACFIGHRFNAVCSEIQVMEDQRPGYSPSFLLL